VRWAFGYDHAGFQLAQHLDAYLAASGHEVEHYGPSSNNEPVDYVPFCLAAAFAVAEGRADFGAVIGGSGQGEQMVANKVPSIRAALCTDPHYARLARRDNDANVIGLPARIIAPEFAIEILDVWIATEFEGGRHARRLALIDSFEDGTLDVSSISPHPRPTGVGE